MPNFAQVTLIGHVGRDPETKFTDQGVQLTKFSVAVTNKRTNTTTWYSVTTWRGLAEVCAQYVKKGHAVFVQGDMELHEYTGRDGSARAEIRVDASAVQFLTRTDGGQSDEQEEPEARGRSQKEIPF